MGVLFFPVSRWVSEFAPVNCKPVIAAGGARLSAQPVQGLYRLQTHAVIQRVLDGRNDSTTAGRRTGTARQTTAKAPGAMIPRSRCHPASGG